MARKRRSKGGKRRGWWTPVLLATVLAAAATAGWWYWSSRHWRPSEASYPEQGVLVGEGDGAVRFAIVKGLGGSFAYL
ncbi:MAG: lysozyme, partial [Sphingomonadales bacterium]